MPLSAHPMNHLSRFSVLRFIGRDNAMIDFSNYSRAKFYLRKIFRLSILVRLSEKKKEEKKNRDKRIEIYTYIYIKRKKKKQSRSNPFDRFNRFNGRNRYTINAWLSCIVNANFPSRGRFINKTMFLSSQIRRLFSFFFLSLFLSLSPIFNHKPIQQQTCIGFDRGID